MIAMSEFTDQPTTGTQQADANEIAQPESMSALVERHRQELQSAISIAEVATRAAKEDAQAAVRVDASAALTETLATIRQRPTFTAYSSVPAEHKIQLSKTKDAGAAAVVIVPHPDAHGYQKRAVRAVLDVVREVRR